MDGQCKISQGSQVNRVSVRPAALCLCVFWLWTAPEAVGQRVDLEPRERALQIDYAFEDQAQAFPPAVWDFRNAGFARGVVVSWELEAFTHTRFPQHQADADVQVRLIRAGSNGRWRITQEYDATNLAAGRESAVVSVASDGRGRGAAELLVRFVIRNPRQVAAGTYHATVTGTISGQ